MAACEEFNRSTLVRRGIAQAGGGLPAIERGMPAPAGTGIDRRTFLMRSTGAALTVFGASISAPAISRTGSPPQLRRRRGSRCSFRSSWQGGWDGMSVLAPVGDPLYAKLRPSVGLAPGSGIPFSEDSATDVAPVGCGPRDAARGGQGHDLPGDRLQRTRTRAISRAATTGRSASSTRTRRPAGWGAILDIVGRPDNPLQGLSLDSTLAPSLASAKAPVAAVSSPVDFRFWANGLGDPVLSEALATLGELGSIPGALARDEAVTRCGAQPPRS